MNQWFQNEVYFFIHTLMWIAFFIVGVYAIFVLDKKAFQYGLKSLMMKRSDIEKWMTEMAPKLVFYGEREAAAYLTTSCDENTYRFITVERYTGTSKGIQIAIVAVKKSSSLLLFHDRDVVKGGFFHIFIVNLILRPVLGGKFGDYIDIYPCHREIVYKDDYSLSIMEGNILQEEGHYRINPGF